MNPKSDSVVIRHLEGGPPARFTVSRLQGGSETEPVVIRSPAEIATEGRLRSNLLQELQWYLEQFLEYPLPPETDRALHVLSALARWGEESFRALLGVPEELSRHGSFRIESNEPEILAWPWEALRHPHQGALGRIAQMERGLATPFPSADHLPETLASILLVIARPYQKDVRYRSISQPLLDAIERTGLPIRVHVLRPPTPERLREVLETYSGEFQILHFDGHGSYRESSAGPVEGHLIFETPDGGPAAVSASALGHLFQAKPVPLVVLNACESGRLDGAAENAFASVAAAFLASGSQNVVAMAYKLWATGAQWFIRSFYRVLLGSGDISEAVREGRRSMVEQPARACNWGLKDLEDWLVPVLYRRGKDESLDYLPAGEAPLRSAKARALHRLVGRDEELRQIERALRRRPAGILIHGHRGIGKTELARATMEWLQRTEGLQEPAWMIRCHRLKSAEQLLSRMGEQFVGPSFARLGNERYQALANSLRSGLRLIVWDGLETLGGGSDPQTAPADRQIVIAILRALRGGGAKIIITSRGNAPWLASESSEVPLAALPWEDRRRLARRIRRNPRGKAREEVAGDLLEAMSGNPLIMGALLPFLDRHDSTELTRRFRFDLRSLLGAAEHRAAVDLHKALREMVFAIPEDDQPLLGVLAWRERFIGRDDFERILQAVGLPEVSDRFEGFVARLAAAGGVRIQGALLEVHPGLPGFLRSDPARAVPGDSSDPWVRATIEALAISVDLVLLVYPDEPASHVVYLGAHDADMHQALDAAEKLAMPLAQASLLQGLGFLAIGRQAFAEAKDFFLRLASVCRTMGRPKGEAGAYHQLGRIAEDLGDREEAERWYLKSLPIKERLGDTKGTSRTLHQLGRLAEDFGDLEAADRWYRDSLERKEALGDEEGAAATYHQLGRLAEKLRHFDEARRWYIQSAEIEEKLGNQGNAAKSWHQLGRVAQEVGDLASAERSYLRALLINQKIENVEGVARNCHHLGQVADERRDFEAAESWYRRALLIDESTGNWSSAAKAYHHMGMASVDKGNHEAAREWYLKSLRIEEDLRDMDGIADTYHQLGMLERSQGNFEQAISWLQRSLEIAKEMGDREGIAKTLHELGRVAQVRGDSEAAERWYLEALAIKESLGDDRLLKSTYQNLGILAQGRSDYDVARRWYWQSLCIAQKYSSHAGMARSQANLGTVEAICGRLVPAGAWFAQAVRSFRAANEPERAEATRDLFAIVYGRSGPENRSILRAIWSKEELGEWPSDPGGSVVVLPD